MSAITPDDRVEPTEVPGEEAEFTRLKADVLAGHRQRSKWRTEARRAFNFVASRQWSEEDKMLLAEQKRPAVTFNRTEPVIKAVCGLEVNNRQDIVYLPREQGDVGIDETLTSCVKWVRDENNGPDEESLAFRDNAICGEGWTETRMDNDNGTACPIEEERIDPLEMGVNAGVYRANHSQARLIYRVRDIDSEDARALLGTEYSADVLHADWMEDMTVPEDGGVGFKKDYPTKTRDGVNADGRRFKCRVVQVQWWERETINLVAMQGSSELQELNAEDFAKFQERADAMGIVYDHEPTKKKVYYEAFLGKSLVGKRKLEMGMFQFQCMTGEYDREEKCFYALLRAMFDPQMWANKFLSQTMNILNSNAKGGLIAEKGVFDNQRKAEKDWSDPTKIVFVKDGKLDRLRDRNAPPMPQGLDQLMMFAVNSLRDVSGINLELLGQADREQAASLEMQRRQAAITILATLFDSKRKYSKRQGKLLLHFVWLLPDDTLVRVLSKGQYRYVPLIKNKDVEAYDIIVDEAPTSPNQKQYIWATTLDLLGKGIQLPPATIGVLLEYSPYPESVVKEIRESMGLGDEMPPEQMKQKLAQAEQALHVMEEELKKAMEAAKEAEDESEFKHMQAEVANLKTVIDAYKAQTDRLSAEWSAKHDAAGLAVDVATTPGPLDGAEGAEAAPAAPQSNNEIAEVKAQVAELATAMQQLIAHLQGSPPQQPAAPMQEAPVAE